MSDMAASGLRIRRLEDGRPPLTTEPWPRRVERVWPWAQVRVYVASAAMADVWRSVGRCPGCGRISRWAARERGGALAGRYAMNELGRRFIFITDAIPAPTAPSSGVTIDIRTEEWKAIHRRIAELPGRRLLGWYHSQPGLGVQMSRLDLETQRRLFAPDWQAGLVVDPMTGAFRFYLGASARRVQWLAFSPGGPRWMPASAGERAAAGLHECGQEVCL